MLFTKADVGFLIKEVTGRVTPKFEKGEVWNVNPEVFEAGSEGKGEVHLVMEIHEQRGMSELESFQLSAKVSEQKTFVVGKSEGCDVKIKGTKKAREKEFLIGYRHDIGWFLQSLENSEGLGLQFNWNWLGRQQLNMNSVFFLEDDMTIRVGGEKGAVIKLQLEDYKDQEQERLVSIFDYE
jgi:hypothetical protein